MTWPTTTTPNRSPNWATSNSSWPTSRTASAIIWAICSPKKTPERRPRWTMGRRAATRGGGNRNAIITNPCPREAWGSFSCQKTRNWGNLCLCLFSGWKGEEIIKIRIKITELLQQQQQQVLLRQNSFNPSDNNIFWLLHPKNKKNFLV